MNCFDHPKTSAVGLCKHCCKGLCAKCVHSLNGWFCCESQECQRDLEEQTQIIERSKKIYGIGAQSKKGFSPLGIFFVMMGFLFTIGAAYEYVQTQYFDPVFTISGLFFLGWGFYSAFRNDRLNY